MIDELIEAKARRDIIRGSIIHELLKLPLTKALEGLLIADEIAGRAILAALEKNR